MKKILFTLVFALLSQMIINAQTAKITVTVPFECWVTVVNNNESANEQYGWWDVWHTKKMNLNYAITSQYNNYTVTVPAAEGINTVIVYLPNGNNSDGVVLENLNTVNNGEYKFTYSASDFKDWNCLSCPWLYVFDGKQYIKNCEIIKDVVGLDNKETNSYKLDASAVINGQFKIKIQEEKEETSFLDRIALKVNGKYFTAEIAENNKALAQNDENYLQLINGESIELVFNIPQTIKIETLELEASGYYEPSIEYLAEVFERCMIKR